jgi:perosamine synthetase
MKPEWSVVKVGIIGTGVVAREHAKALAMLPANTNLIAAADVAPERLRHFCHTFAVPHSYGSAVELISDPDVDLVTITTPPAAHEALVVSALEHGKYVFCEKPLAHSLASAVRIAEAAAHYPGRLATSYQMRYDTSFRRLLWLCQNNWIGDIKSVSIARHSYIPHSEHGATEWWGSWNVAGGGVLLTQSVHDLDILFLLLGRPSSVSATMNTAYTGIESEDQIEAIFRYPDGTIARCVASVNSGHLGGQFSVIGSSGTVSLPWNLAMSDPSRVPKALAAVNKALPDTCSQSASIAKFASRLLTRGRGDEGRPELTAHARLYLEIVHQIQRGGPLPIPADQALGSLELCMAAYESALSGKEITFPLSRSSAVFNGVRKEDYDARKCSRNISDRMGLSNSSPLSEIDLAVPLSRSVKRAAIDSAKRVLAMANIEPPMVKALLRKPPPVHGGPVARRWPWPRRRSIDRRERRAALSVINREILFGGAITYGGLEEKAYCDNFVKYLGGGYADAVNSGTNALYIALRALDLEPGTEVIVPPITDAGGMMPVAMNICIPVPADSDRGSVLTSADQIAKVITDRTSAIVVTHIAGHPVDMDPVLQLAAERGIPVVEDCAQAHGAVYKGRMVGTMGRIAAFSTMYGKHHTTGGQGGVVFTKDNRLFAKAKQIADRGKSYDGRGRQNNLVASLNFNQNEISMAIGRVQLAKLPGFIEARRRFVSFVETGLQGIDGVSVIGEAPDCRCSYLFMMLRLDLAKLRCDPGEFSSALGIEGIGGVVAGYSVYPSDQPWHRDAAVFGTSGLPWSLSQQKPRRYELPNAREANRSIVCVDVHESLGIGEARDLVTAIKKIVQFYRAS